MKSGPFTPDLRQVRPPPHRAAAVVEARDGAALEGKAARVGSRDAAHAADWQRLRHSGSVLRTLQRSGSPPIPGVLGIGYRAAVVEGARAARRLHRVYDWVGPPPHRAVVVEGRDGVALEPPADPVVGLRVELCARSL